MRSVRFRTLGCYPLTGAIESSAATLPDIILETLAAATSERWGRLIDSRQRLVDGAEEAAKDISDMLHADANPAFEDFLEAQSRRGRPAVHHLRLGRRRQVDADRPPAARSNQLFDDQLTALKRDSRRFGTREGDIDFALLVDGLAAEREQGITIDVAYRFFATRQTQLHRGRYAGPRAIYAQHGDGRIDRRSRSSAGRRTKGHQPANTATLASRFRMLRVRQSRARDQQDGPCRLVAEPLSGDHRASTGAYVSGLGFKEITGIPISALSGDNVVHQCVAASWYEGPSLLHHLESVRIDSKELRGAVSLAPAMGQSADAVTFAGMRA